MRDKYNDPSANAVTVAHDDLQVKIREARERYHERLNDRFHDSILLSVKRFWFVSAMLDPRRFKKLSFDGDTFIKAGMRRDGVKWLSEEYNTSFKHKVHDTMILLVRRPHLLAAMRRADDEGTSETTAAFLFQPKRRKVTSATFFKPRVPGEANQVPTPATAPLPKDEDVPHDDELAAYT